MADSGGSNRLPALDLRALVRLAVGGDDLVRVRVRVRVRDRDRLRLRLRLRARARARA